MSSCALILLLGTIAYAQDKNQKEKIKVKLEKMILQLSDRPAKEAFLGFMVNEENFDLIDKIVSEYGGVSSVQCFNGHSSQLFFYYICSTTYREHKSGNGLHFYVFDEGTNYIGTRFGVSDFYASKDQCLTEITISKGLFAKLSFKVEECHEV
jgi:hypothetical protein